MNVKESVRVALRGLRANKMRSALTMLGVVIGVGAVILLVSIGTGVKNEVTGQIVGLGSNLLFVFPGKMGPGGGGGGGPQAITKKLRLPDADVIRRRASHVEVVVPIVQAPVTVKAGRDDLRAAIYGGTAEGAKIFSGDLIAGRHYSTAEVDSAARVASLGWTVADALGGRDAVGKTIVISNQRFKVIGVWEEMGGSLGGDQDAVVYMPVTTAQRLLDTSDLSMIAVSVKDISDMDQARAEIGRALEPRFGDEFTVFSQDQMLGILSTLLGTLTLMLAGIAGISLLVGGIGIMNIMLVSVTERTREIGIRKAVGARTHDILTQFVVEAVTLAVVGGAAGILMGALGSLAIDRWVPTAVTWWAVALAFGFSAAVGIFFGVYPAWKASRLEPIQALRYE
jgi:putative ABC transport system permease protein